MSIISARSSWPLAALVLVLAASPTPAHAQIGLRGGVNLSKFVGADAGDESVKGLNLGASLSLLNIGPVSIGPEIYYAKKGGQFDPATPESFEMELSYLEVPLLARFTFPLGDRFQGYVGGGPVYAWNLDCQFNSSTDPNLEAQECGQQFETFDTAMASADKGIVANAGINFPVLGGFGGLHLDARVVRGLDRIIESDTETSEPDIKNQAFTLMLGWYLGG